jgi:hypothetical protein
VARDERKNEAAVKAQIGRLEAEASRPIVVKGGKTLRLLTDCRSYVLDLDEFEAARVPWEHAAQLMLTAAKGGSLEEVVRQFERILIHQNKLVLQG